MSAARLNFWAPFHIVFVTIFCFTRRGYCFLLPAVGLCSSSSIDLLFSSWGSTLAHYFPLSLLAFIFSCFLLGNILNMTVPSVKTL